VPPKSSGKTHWTNTAAKKSPGKLCADDADRFSDPGQDQA